jgi:hypothetical protein
MRPRLSSSPTFSSTRHVLRSLSPIALSDARLQGKAAQQATWQFFDLWEKDSQGAWGASAKTVRGAIADVPVRTHAVRVWRAVQAKTSVSARLVQEL